MTLKLNKYDIISTVLLLIISASLLIYVIQTNNQTKSAQADVYYQNKVVYTFDLTNKKYSKYEIKATNGLVVIESKDGKVRVKSETSKNNLCSIQGWSDSVTNPIVCLPNNLYIKIKSNQQDVDVFIK